MRLLIAWWLLRWILVLSIMVLAAKTTINDSSTRPAQLKIGEPLKVATWNCGGQSLTQKLLLQELDYDILAITETHDKGRLGSGRNYIPSDPVPSDDSFAGVAISLSNKVTNCLI